MFRQGKTQDYPEKAAEIAAGPEEGLRYVSDSAPGYNATYLTAFYCFGPLHEAACPTSSSKPSIANFNCAAGKRRRFKDVGLDCQIPIKSRYAQARTA